MKWQNIIKKQCPKCEQQELKPWTQEIKPKHPYYECKVCGFRITEEKIYDILADKSHAIHKFLTPEEEKTIQKAIGVL